jgi:hypothetical protein
MTTMKIKVILFAGAIIVISFSLISFTSIKNPENKAKFENVRASEPAGGFASEDKL